MFEGLAKHRVIFVTGPHRSGTTICAKMIAHDTGHDLVLEDDFHYSRIQEFLAFIHSRYAPCVIQCPFLSHIIHDLEYIGGVDMDECLVVFMHRYRPDIIASEMRARAKGGQKVNFAKIGAKTRANYHTSRHVHASDAKLESWFHQCKVIPHALDVGYESLRDHPLWIEKRDFTLRQTSPDDPGPDVQRVIPRIVLDGIRTLSVN